MNEAATISGRDGEKKESIASGFSRSSIHLFSGLFFWPFMPQAFFPSFGPIDARRKKGTLILGHNSNKSWYFASGRGTKTLRAKKTSLRVKSGKSFPSIVEGTKPGFRAKWHKFYARFEMHFWAQIPRLTPHFLPPLLLLLLLLREWLFGFFRFLPSSRQGCQIFGKRE